MALQQISWHSNHQPPWIFILTALGWQLRLRDVKQRLHQKYRHGWWQIWTRNRVNCPFQLYFTLEEHFGAFDQFTGTRPVTGATWGSTLVTSIQDTSPSCSLSHQKAKPSVTQGITEKKQSLPASDCWRVSFSVLELVGSSSCSFRWLTPYELLLRCTHRKLFRATQKQLEQQPVVTNGEISIIIA